MSFAGWLVAISIAIIIVFLALGIAWSIRNNSKPIPIPAQLTTFTNWSQPVAVDGDKGLCQLYTFPTSTIPTSIGLPPGTVLPGAPTLDVDTLDNLSGFTGSFTCIDSDQTSASKVTHNCVAPFGVIENQISLCRTLDGGYTGLGGSETFYAVCPTSNNGSGYPPCVGEVALVSINYQVPNNVNFYCIQSNGENQPISMFPCDPSNQQQLFRVTRVNPGQSPYTLKPGQGQNGSMAQIFDRNTGLCLVPASSAYGLDGTPSVYDPAYQNLPQCTGSKQTFTGNQVVISTCTGGTYPGYGWYLLPSSTYCDQPSGCAGCTGCSNCSNPLNTTTCSGCNGCVGNASLVNVPQMVWVGDLDLSTMPGTTGNSGYAGLTGNSAIIQWLIDNNAPALYFGSPGSNLILTSISTDNRDCAARPGITQYINLTTYNIISQQAACTQTGDGSIINCPFF